MQVHVSIDLPLIRFLGHDQITARAQECVLHSARLYKHSISPMHPSALDRAEVHAIADHFERFSAIFFRGPWFLL
jgi:hypothetical protein